MLAVFTNPDNVSVVYGNNGNIKMIIILKKSKGKPCEANVSSTNTLSAANSVAMSEAFFSCGTSGQR